MPGSSRPLDRAGADVLEVGIPFSDPLADGPAIQRSSERALAGGTTLATQSRSRREGSILISTAPVVIFSYANPVLAMGLDVFVRAGGATPASTVSSWSTSRSRSLTMPAQDCGTDGRHRPDLLAEPDHHRGAHRQGRGPGARLSLWHLPPGSDRRERDTLATGARELVERASDA